MTIKQPFVHCHVHTEFSILEAVGRVNAFVKKAAEMDMPALAITDQGSMYGAFQFHKACRSAGIKPLLGCEMFIAPDGRLEKAEEGRPNAQTLVLLAKNNQGYRNLLKLVSLSNKEGYCGEKPRIDHEVLEKYSRGLIAMSSNLGGEIPQYLIKEDYEKARQSALWYQERLDFYLELQDHGLSLQKQVNQGLIQLHKELNIPLVATNDVHYLDAADARAHEIMMCISTGRTLLDHERINYPGGPEYYLKSAKEMYQLFNDVPQALQNTLEIAEKCHVIIDTNSSILPVFEVPSGHDEYSYLEELTWAGLDKRYPEITQEIKDRTNYELGIIKTMGFSSYFLIVWDYTNFARENGIAVGPGRGSAAGSLVSYALRITDIDPLKYSLLFERFLNPERISMPDVDSDFCIERREEVINYVVDKYGFDQVAQIMTVGTLGAKAVVRDVNRAMGMPPQEGDRIAKMIPDGVGIKLKDALKDGMDLKKECEVNPQVNELVEYSLRLEGLARQTGIHAAGVVISRDPLDTVVPLLCPEDGLPITQYTKDEVEEIGLLKMDFLGLRNLTMISKALTILKQSRNLELDIDAIPYDNQDTFDLLSGGQTVGVFQLESTGMQKLVRALVPNVFEEIIALVALYRPGPLGSGMVDEFVERKHGRKPITYPDTLKELLEPILKDTYGLIIYQEQIMQIAQTIAGYTLGQADILRKAMGKKKVDVMAKQRIMFVDGAKAKGINPKLAEELFDIMEEFAKYGFNKSHSAAYAFISYQTAYLKANYPVEYMAALISSVMGTQDKVPFYVNEARQMNILILPPDINQSHSDFTVRGEKIRFGLSAVKNVGSAAVDNIIDNREEFGEFKSIFDFCERVDLRVVNKRALESLIKAGAFDLLHDNRKQLIESVDEITTKAAKANSKKNENQTSLFELEGAETIDLGDQITFPDVEDYGFDEKLEQEKEVIGIYVSGHPLDQVQHHIERFARHTIVEAQEFEEEREVIIGGHIMTKKMLTTRKKGDTMAVLQFEDLTGNMPVVVFPKAWAEFGEVLDAETKFLITGVIGRKRDENEPNQIILNHVRPLEQIKTLNLTFETFEIRRLTALRLLLQEYPGDVPVMLYSTGDEESAVAVGCDFWIKPEEKLMNKLCRALGQTNVQLSGSVN